MLDASYGSQKDMLEKDVPDVFERFLVANCLLDRTLFWTAAAAVKCLSLSWALSIATAARGRLTTSAMAVHSEIGPSSREAIAQFPPYHHQQHDCCAGYEEAGHHHTCLITQQICTCIQWYLRQ
ncbi:hypothetical protein ACOMHN_018827 [Nucella lapillus]